MSEFERLLNLLELPVVNYRDDMDAVELELQDVFAIAKLLRAGQEMKNHLGYSYVTNTGEPSSLIKKGRGAALNKAMAAWDAATRGE